MAKKSALLVMGMQNDFIVPTSPFHLPNAHFILPSVIQAVSVARERGHLIVWVVREHDPMGRDDELFRRHSYANGNGPAVTGSKGAELVDGLIQQKGDYKLVKTRFSAFMDTNLNSLLQSNGINSLIVVGVQTPVCIRQTIFDVVSLNYEHVTIIVDAIAAQTTEVQAANVLDMKKIGVTTPTFG